MGRNKEARGLIARIVRDGRSTPLKDHGLGSKIKRSFDGENRIKMNLEVPPGRELRVIKETRLWERV